MVNNPTQEETKKRFDSLPPEIKNLLYSFEMTSAITKIGEKYGLHIDQMELLNAETAQVMLGFTKIEDFPLELSKTLGIDEQKSVAISGDINAMLFIKVRAAMNQPSAVAATAPMQKQPLSEILPKESISIPVQTAPAAPIAAPVIPPTLVAPAPTAPIAPLPSIPKIDMHPADIALTQKTVAAPAPVAPAMPATPPAAKPAIDAKIPPPKPTDYKADPYREPIS